MAQLTHGEIVQKALAEASQTGEAVLALIDRQRGAIAMPEGELLDYKERLPDAFPGNVGELARDVLAFSNTQGGMVLIGVRDDGTIVGSAKIDARALRDALGPYAGTRIDFDIVEVMIGVQGNQSRLYVISVRRSLVRLCQIRS